MISIFLTSFALGGDFKTEIRSHPILRFQEVAVVDSLVSCFGERGGLLAACLDAVPPEQCADLIAMWKDVVGYYHATEQTTCTQGYANSAKFEFFYALCSLAADKREVFLCDFKKFYNKIFNVTSTSASFLMLCVLFETGNPQTFKLLNDRVKACNSADPFQFLGQFERQDHGLPNAFTFMNAGDRQDAFMIAHLQRLAAATAV